ncbi:cytochrome p450 [Coprinopsis cinerea AmutBmut pab1-1]|nr:cytochrome p450 [Coprinopsis cinerea AmutBmut pab1-1]
MLIQLTGSLFAAWLTYRGLRWYLVPDPIDLLPGPRPKSWLTGDINDLINPNGWEFHARLEREYGPISNIKSFLGSNFVHIYDPKALYHVLVKDQDTFEENPIFRITFEQVFGKGLLSTFGDQHRKQRKMLNPAFSIAHLKELVPVFHHVSQKLREGIKQQLAEGKDEIDILSWSTRTALELIGQSGLGYSFDTLESDTPEHPFSTAIRGFAQLLNTFTISRFVVLPLVHDLFTPSIRRFVVDILPWPRLHRLRDMIDTMHNTCVQIFEDKKRGILEGSQDAKDGKDIISILMRANMSASETDRLPDSELLAQLSTLTFAAMDTTSNTTARLIHTLASNPTIQSQLRSELLNAKANVDGRDLTYEELDQLPLLDAVCRETLRLYPVAPYMVRYTNKPAVLPLSTPLTLRDGTTTTTITIPAKTDILVGILACNRNPDLWGPDANEWKPERWLKGLPQEVMDAKVPGIYSHLMTFIGGGRACIGFKFAILELKVILTTLLEAFEFSPTSQTVGWQFNGVTQPVVHDPTAPPGTSPKIMLPVKASLAQPQS